MNANPSFNWEKLDTTYYRSRELTNVKWSKLSITNKDKDMFCTSLCFMAIVNQNEYIEIYDYLGNLVKSISVKMIGKGSLIDIQFRDQLGAQLIIIMDDSVRLLKDWNTLDIQVIDLPSELQDTIWDYKDDIIIMKSSQDLWKCHWDQSKMELLHKNNNTEDNDDHFRLLTKSHWTVSQSSKRVLLLDVNNVFEFNTQGNNLNKIPNLHEWHKVCISPSGLICFYNYKFNKFQIYKSLRENCLAEIELDDNQISPKSLTWLPDDLPALIFDDEVRIYSNNGSYITFWYPDDIMAVNSQIDGLRVLTNSNLILISKVDTSTAGIFRIGSTEPGAMLLDSWSLVADHPAKAIERLSNFNLKQAVNDCIMATKDEFEPDMQKQLLNSVVFGKNSLPFKTYDSNEFVKTCNLMRLLNVLRGLGLFISEKEYQKQGLDKVLDVLFLMNRYAEAIEIIKITGQNSSYTVLFFHWASTKIKNSGETEDDELLQIIQNQLTELPKGVNPPMAKIAQVALLEGRYTLCRELSLLETNPISKIMALYSLDDDSIAIKEALNTQNPELVISLLLKLKEKLTPAQLAKLLILDTSDDQLYCYFNRHNLNFLMDFYGQTDKFLDLAYCIMEQGRKQGDINAILPQVKELIDKLPHHKNSPVGDDSKNITRAITLSKFQESLTNIFNTDFTHFTLDETLSKLIEMKQEKYVKELLKKFRINERKFYHIKCKVLVETGRFDELSQLATSKKSPIGYEIFYHRLLDKGFKREASLYIDMIPNLSTEERHKMLLDCKQENQAA